MTDFVQFAESYGLIIRNFMPDGRWHRTCTTDKAKSKKNGAYVYLDGRGACKNWATMQEFALYREDRPSATPTVDRQRLRQLRQQAVREERQRHEKAARQAADMLKRATLIRPRAATKWADGVYTHPYLARKGFPAAECLVLDGLLLVPMRDLETDRLVGMQTIDAEGKKLFIPGSRAKGAVFRVGRAAETWLCEGLATALSVQAGLKALYREACVLVCFSAGNLVTVAGKLPVGALAFVVADNDASGAGLRAAEATGLPFVIPDAIGDANDVHQAKGIKAVRDLLRRVL